jgi:DNA-binding SARP family transcriptional activator
VAAPPEHQSMPPESMPAARSWEFRVLGSLEALQGGEPVAIGGQRQRALLALLVLEANRVVPTERLVDRLWGERPPPTAVTSLQNGIGQLRKALGADRVETRPPGYLMHVSPEELDLTRFEHAARDARDRPAAERAQMLRDALALWRGPPLADFTYEAFAQGEIARLEELRLTALEERIDAELELGAHAAVVPELEALVAEHPVRERLRGQLMLSLYRSGRQAEALEAYRSGRRALTEELGIEPTPTLQRLNAAILRQDASLDAAGAPPAVGDEVQEAARALLAGRLVLVVGPEVNGGSDGPPLRPADMAAHLVESFDCPADEARELARVAQYVAVTRGVGPLYDELHELLSMEHPWAPAHAAVAELAALLREIGAGQPVIVSTTYDRCLESALTERGLEFDTLVTSRAVATAASSCTRARTATPT